MTETTTAEARGLDAPAADWADRADRAYAAGDPDEGARCFARALWAARDAGEDASHGDGSHGDDSLAALAARWAAAEEGDDDAASLLDRALDDDLPEHDQPDAGPPRAVAALLVAAQHSPASHADAITPRLRELDPWFDARDHVLDIRVAWLAQMALASLTDEEAVARLFPGQAPRRTRARERFLRRLRPGLSAALDLPRALEERTPPDQPDARAARLEALRDAVHARPDHPHEADAALTRAYADLAIAVGHARLGDAHADRASELRDEALVVLDEAGALDDPLHASLAGAYTERVDDVLAGRSRLRPLPELLTATPRYAGDKRDRILCWSPLLAPERTPDHDDGDAHGQPTQPLDKALTATAMASLDDEQLLRRIDALPDAGEAEALGTLRELVAHVGRRDVELRIALLARAAAAAAHLGQDGLARFAVQKLHKAVDELPALERADALWWGDVARLRPLARCGLRAEATEALEAMLRWREDDTPPAPGKAGNKATHRIARSLAGALRGGTIDPEATASSDGAQALRQLTGERIQLAQTLIEHGLDGQARAILLREVTRPHITDADRARAVGALAALVPLDTHDQLLARLPDVTDTFGTNSHLCAALQHVVESLVLATIGAPTGTAWLADDEARVRARLHADAPHPAG